MKPRGCFFLILLTCVTLTPAMGLADEVVGPARLLSSAAVEDIVYTNDSVAGRIINRSDKRLENVRILVTYPWLWADDRRTDDTSPGWSEYHIVAGPVPANGALSFSFPHTSLHSERNDGNFLPSVQMVGFTEVAWLSGAPCAAQNQQRAPHDPDCT